MVGRVLGGAERALFHPEELPSGLVFVVAMVPTIVAGILLFRAQAAAILAVAVAVAIALHVLARILRLPTGMGMLIPALVGVSLVGPGAALQWALIVAVAAGLLELCRASLIPSARVHTGLLAYAGVFVAARGSLDRYLAPGSGRPLSEPISLWLNFFSAGSRPIDPIRLYIGNVPGPVFATSLLAIVIGAAWFWYAHRLSVAVLAGFLLASLLPIWLFAWDPTFQLLSGPTWLVVALILADRAMLPESIAPRPLIGVAAGVGVMAMRLKGFGIEGSFLAVAAVQLLVAAVDGAAWLAGNRIGAWRRAPASGQRNGTRFRLSTARRNTA